MCGVVLLSHYQHRQHCPTCGCYASRLRPCPAVLCIHHAAVTEYSPGANCELLNPTFRVMPVHMCACVCGMRLCGTACAPVRRPRLHTHTPTHTRRAWHAVHVPGGEHMQRHRAWRIALPACLHAHHTPHGCTSAFQVLPSLYGEARACMQACQTLNSASLHACLLACMHMAPAKVRLRCDRPDKGCVHACMLVPPLLVGRGFLRLILLQLLLRPSCQVLLLG